MRNRLESVPWIAVLDNQLGSVANDGEHVR